MIGLSARNENLGTLRNTNITLISRTYCLRNHFHHWKVVFSWGKVRKSQFSQNPLPILISWNLIVYTFLCTKNKKNYHGQYFFYRSFLGHSSHFGLIPIIPQSFLSFPSHSVSFVCPSIPTVRKLKHFSDEGKLGLVIPRK